MARHSDSVLANLTAERARLLLAYNPDTGSLTWRNPTARAVKAGDVAGTRTGKKGGYRSVSLDDNIFMAHRVVWLMVYGKWPDGDVATRNGDFQDLRIGNLFKRTAAETAQSQRQNQTPRAKSGIRGVYEQPNGKWSAQIRRNYRMHHLGSFPTKESAAAALEKAKLETLPSADQDEISRKAQASRAYGLVHGLWQRTLRDHAVVPAWQSLPAFAEAVSNDAYPQCRLVPIDATKPLGPDNFRIEARAKYDRRTPEGRKAYYDYKNKANTVQRSHHHRRSKFGLEPEQHAEMLNAQGHVCASCNQRETYMRAGRIHPLSVDHCHDTGEIRGLLCHGCNAAIGYARNDPARLRAAADYLDRHAAKSAKMKSASVPASNVIPLKQKER